MTTTKNPTAAKPRRVKTTAAKKTTAPAKAKAKPSGKVSAAPAKSSQVNPHIEAGLDASLYDGPSSYVNGNRSTKIMLGREVPASRITSRAQRGLYALRSSYKGEAFNPRGFDNGVLRDLLGAGLVARVGSSGQEQTINGKAYLLDGDRPVQLRVTAEGLTYGKA